MDIYIFQLKSLLAGYHDLKVWSSAYFHYINTKNSITTFAVQKKKEFWCIRYSYVGCYV